MLFGQRSSYGHHRCVTHLYGIPFFIINCAIDYYCIFTHMKHFLLLFNIYLLSLAFFPCADVDTCIESNESLITTSTNNKEDHKEAENCTPFCICTCCAAPIIHQAIGLGETSKQTYFTTSYPSLSIHYPSHAAAAIWQPPKFC